MAEELLRWDSTYRVSTAMAARRLAPVEQLKRA
jgi:hypothetical protein